MASFTAINDALKTSKAQITVDSLKTFKTQMRIHQDPETLKSHLETQYSTTITKPTPQRGSVYRVDRTDGPSWTARLFPAARPVEDVEDEARILQYLEGQDFPAERCAHPMPVSSLPHGEAVLLTTFIKGATPQIRDTSFSALGDLLGRLHKLRPPEGVHFRNGGAWHEICLQGRKRFFFEEVHTALKVALKSIGAVENLRQALIHPAFVRRNAVLPDGDESGDFKMVNWTGAGMGPRIFSLGWALWDVHELKRVQLFMKGYLKHVKLEPQELERLAEVIWARRLVLGAWYHYEGGQNREQATAALEGGKEYAQRIAEKVKDMNAREAIGAQI